MNDTSQKINIIAIFGESGSGKDTIQKWIVSKFPNTNGIVNCTTRPSREEEKDGIDYYFLSVEQFTKELLNGNLIEANEFNNWFYGTRIQELDKDKVNVGVFSISSIECLLSDSRLNVTPIYISSTDKDRLLRALNRENNPNCLEICRRFMADEKDFADINFEYQTVCNNNDEFEFTEIQIARILNSL